MSAPLKFHCPECGAMKEDPQEKAPGCVSNEEWCSLAVENGDAYVHFDDVSEDERERWRAENLELNVLEGSAEEEPLPSEHTFDDPIEAAKELEAESVPHPDLPDDVTKDLEGWG